MDSTGTPTIPAGPFGEHTCDTPTSLVQSMLRDAAAKNAAFSIFTGDVVEGIEPMLQSKSWLTIRQTWFGWSLSRNTSFNMSDVVGC